MTLGYKLCLMFFVLVARAACASIDGDDPVTNLTVWYPRHGGATTLPLALKFIIGANSSDGFKSRYGNMLICVELNGVAKKCSSTIGMRIRWQNLPDGSYVARAYFSDGENGARFHETGPVSFQILGAEDFDAHIKQQLEQIRADQNFPPDLSISQWMQRIQSEDLPFQNTLVNRPTIVQGSPSDEVRLVIGIKTAVLKNFAQRQAIRETWANTTGLPTHVNVSFLDILEAVELERDIYGDLLTDELEYDDEYWLHAGKVSAFLEWVIAELPRTEFVMITDDDDFVRVDKLVEDLEVLPREGFNIGDLPDTLHSAPLWPIRDPANAYYISRDNYPLEQLFPYAGGPHYLLSMDCVRFIGKNRGRLASIGGDDTSVALWFLAVQIHVQYTSAFASLRLWPCMDNLVSFADLSPLGMRIIHDNLLNKRNFCHNFDRDLRIAAWLKRLKKQIDDTPRQLKRLKRTMQVKYPIMGLSYARGLFAICGGGGSLKSGIKNTVDIYQLSDTDPTGFTKEITADTGLELASGVAFSHDGQLIAVSVSAGCWVYALDLKEKTITLLVKFRTDFHEEDSSQTCARFVGNSTILTGGEDGVVRIWRLSRDPSKPEKAVGSAKALTVPEERDLHANVVAEEQPKLGDCVINGANMVTLTREYRGHTKRIRDIDVDLSHRNLVASSSEDQSCHLWRLTEVTPICKFSKDDALDIALQRLPTKPIVGPRKHVFRCVRFSNSGRRLYTMLTPARGDSILIKWKPGTIAQENEEQWTWVVEETAIAGEKPVASLCVSQDDRFVCAAAVTGDIKVFLASTLQQYTIKSTEQHSFAITGMSFAPSADKQSSIFHLVSGGADKSLLRHEIPLEGGIVKSGMEIVTGGLKNVVSATVGLGLNLWMATTLLFILLLFIHAKTAMLLDGPSAGFNDLASFSFDSSDGLVTIGALVASSVVTWLFALHSSVTGRFFWNGLLCLLSGLVAFSVAISADLEVNWQTGDAAIDELLGTSSTTEITLFDPYICLVVAVAQNTRSPFSSACAVSHSSFAIRC
ncbi:hypothetical protein, variant 4 [Phytophthora nicotianae P10297]|uniref:Anaphase-promoting complex subunit 4 WD40 domain-containing protein n=1 Tax=Phytophthora nicotianae P10297 TaxID=1317064 RepID=W2YV63_PHYNI|nr:hypothetical protein, variant 3 [Phytophthora nicotianae P10297]ETP38691.1 hypothetical protein, variant 4 [Phytophthora nicotianae P10297]